MNPNQTPNTLNIDDMLQSLEQQTNTPTPETHIATPPVPPPNNQVSNKPKHSFQLPAWVKMLLSAIGTITLLIIAGWILSIQYPEESKSLWNGIRNTFLYIAGVTANNRTSAPLEEQDLQKTEDTLDQHDHTIEPVASPLADAIDQAKQQPQDENKAQTLFQTIASGEDNTIDFNTQQDLTTQLQQSGDYSSQATGIASTYTTPLTLPNTVPRPSIKEFHELVLNLWEKAESAMTHLIGNNDVKLAKMRIVYKNTQTLLNQLSQTTSYTDEQRSHYEQLVEIYESVHPSK